MVLRGVLDLYRDHSGAIEVTPPASESDLEVRYLDNGTRFIENPGNRTIQRMAVIAESPAPEGRNRNTGVYILPPRLSRPGGNRGGTPLLMIFRGDKGRALAAEKRMTREAQAVKPSVSLGPPNSKFANTLDDTRQGIQRQVTEASQRVEREARRGKGSAAQSDAANTMLEPNLAMTVAVVQEDTSRCTVQDRNVRSQASSGPSNRSQRAREMRAARSQISPGPSNHRPQGRETPDRVRHGQHGRFNRLLAHQKSYPSESMIGNQPEINAPGNQHPRALVQRSSPRQPQRQQRGQARRREDDGKNSSRQQLRKQSPQRQYSQHRRHQREQINLAADRWWKQAKVLSEQHRRERGVSLASDTESL